MVRFVRQFWRRHRLAAAVLIALMVSAPALSGVACAAEVIDPASASAQCLSDCGSSETPQDFDACMCSVCHSGHHHTASLPDPTAAPTAPGARALMLAWSDQAVTSPATVRGLERPPRA